MIIITGPRNEPVLLCALASVALPAGWPGARAI